MKPRNLPKQADTPEAAEERFRDALEALVPNEADRAQLLVVGMMVVKAFVVVERRRLTAQNAGLVGTLGRN